MTIFTDWRQAQAAALTAAGFTVTLDPATVNPPCAVVGPVETIAPAGLAAWDVEASVWIVHPAPAGMLALAWLEAKLPAFLAAVSPNDPAEFTVYPHPTGDLPAYRAPVTTTVTE